MKRTLKTIVIIAVLLVVAFLAYDFYMRNSGLSNRIDYEQEKYEFKNNEYNPTRDTPESRQEERQERREERREKVRDFFNGN